MCQEEYTQDNSKSLEWASELWSPQSEVKVTQSCLTLCNPMDYAVHEILQARILECIAFPFSRGSSLPRDQTGISCIAAAAKSLQSCPTRRRQPTRLPHPWDSPGKNTGVGCRFLLQCMKVKSESEDTQSCPTLSDPMDLSLPGSSVHGIFQARVPEWGAITLQEDSLLTELSGAPWAPRPEPIKEDPTEVSLVAQMVKHLPAMWETWVGSLASGRSLGEGNSNPLRYFCLGNPMDRAAWQAYNLRGHKEWDMI